MALCIKAEALTFKYGQDDAERRVLDEVSLEIRIGEFVCLTGPSGSGKSTLLSILGMIELPQQGQLYFCGQRIDASQDAVRDELRRSRIGFVFQDFQLLDVLTAAENVEYFLARQGAPRRERAFLVKKHLEEVGLWELRDRRPGQLSGGQKQRLAIARALAKRPSLIVADEPTANLDRENARVILETLAELSRQRGVTVVMATHDPLALEYCDLAYDLAAGRCSVKQAGAHHAA